ncbi:MAG: ABC transporter permease [Bacteroidales bacterium]
MFQSYVISAIRNFFRQKSGTLINIFGLSVGLCVALIIFLYAHDERQYDRFHENAENIYRITTRFGFQEGQIPLGPWVMNDLLLEQVPGIRSSMRLRPENPEEFSIRIGNEDFLQEGFILTDPHFFRFFSFPLLDGHPDHVLEGPRSAVITREAAEKYFGDENPVGQTILARGLHPFTITGVMADFPEHSHFSGSIVANMELLRDWNRDSFENWGSLGNYYYFLLDENADPITVAKKLNQVVQEHAPEWFSEVTFALQPMLDIRLHSSGIGWDIGSHGNIILLRGLLAVAAIILLLACVNYINLNTAQSSLRRKEVGMRKVLGAGKTDIFWQNLTESFVLVLLSFGLALALAEMLLPSLNDLSGKQMGLGVVFSWQVFPLMLLSLALIAFLAGSYPALVMARFRPADILKGSLLTSPHRGLKTRWVNLRMRQLLIVFQFCCATALVIIGLSVNRQINYMMTMDLGYEQEDLFFVFNPEDEQMESRFLNLKNKLEQYPEVYMVSAGHNVPSEGLHNFSYIRLQEQESEIQVGNLDVHPDYFATTGTRLIAGRYFHKDSQADAGWGAVVINRSAARALGHTPEEIIGKQLASDDPDIVPRIVGVVEDIQFTSGHEQAPAMLFSTGYGDGAYRTILVRTRPGALAAGLEYARGAWADEAVAFPFSHGVVKDNFQSKFQSEEQTIAMVTIFMVLAILISLMGLFALASFVMTSRTREIAVRKVLGASEQKILWMIGKEFSLLVVISSLLAWPVAWLVLGRWLETFAYRQDISLLLFVVGPLVAILAAWCTISYHALRTARVNAAEALKYE